MVEGGEFTEGLIHPEDLEFLRLVVYPTYGRCLRAIPFAERTSTTFSHTLRVRCTDGRYTQVLQQSVPLSFEDDNMSVG